MAGEAVEGRRAGNRREAEAGSAASGLAAAGFNRVTFALRKPFCSHGLRNHRHLFYVVAYGECSQAAQR
jgi:hypothetical protein